MRHMTAMSIGIGILGALATYLTATMLPLPVWVIFIAGLRSLRQAVASLA